MPAAGARPEWTGRRWARSYRSGLSDGHRRCAARRDRHRAARGGRCDGSHWAVVSRDAPCVPPTGNPTGTHTVPSVARPHHGPKVWRRVIRLRRSAARTPARVDARSALVGERHGVEQDEPPFAIAAAEDDRGGGVDRCPLVPDVVRLVEDEGHDAGIADLDDIQVAERRVDVRDLVLQGREVLGHGIPTTQPATADLVDALDVVRRQPDDVIEVLPVESAEQRPNHGFQLARRWHPSSSWGWTASLRRTGDPQATTRRTARRRAVRAVGQRLVIPTNRVQEGS